MVVFAVVSAALAIAMLVAAPLAMAADDRPFSPFGMAAHLIGDYPTSQIDRELDLIDNAGASWIRVDIPWRFMEPVDGNYSEHALGQLDYIVAAAAKRGIRVEAVIVEFPNWSNGNRGMWTPPTNNAELTTFMRFMAGRYKGRISYWELGNEVNETEFWNVPRSSSAQRYVAFLKAGYAGVKAGNPDAKVISAGLAGSDYDYLEEMYDAGAKGYFDLLGVHSYTRGKSPYYEATESFPVGWTFDGLARMKAKMVAHGEPDKNIWVTEFGWQTSAVEDHRVTTAQQAQYTFEAYERLFEGFPYVETMIIYNSRDQGTSRNVAYLNYGLLYYDYNVKPAYAAYRRAFDTFSGVVGTPFRVPTSISISAPSAVTSRRGFTVRFAKRPASAGTVRLSWQTMSGGKWVTRATEYRPVNQVGEGYRYTQRSAKTKWRLVVTYAGSSTQLPSSKYVYITVR